jgi:hypothetical protein
LAAHTIGLMRAIGIRAFQTPLLPGLGREEIKRLNHLPAEVLREEAPPMDREVRRPLDVSEVVGRLADADIHFAANVPEVLFNVQRWNKDVQRPELAEVWGRRRGRYFVQDPRTGNFAPSKFAAYLRLPRETIAAEWLAERSLTGMNVRAYAEIDALNPIFDGNRAWRHLEGNLGMAAVSVAELDATGQEAFSR